MQVETFQLLMDMGLFVLIWIVQLVIYPGFCYSNETDVKRWHKVYTRRITFVVLPLMLGQLIVYFYLAYLVPNTLNLARLSLVLATWGITFIFAVPLHHRIDSLKDSSSVREKLVKINWPRTLIWTMILMISIITYQN